MPEKAENVKNIYAVIAIIVTVAWYGIERIAEVFVSFNKASAVVLAMLSVVALVVVFFLIDSCSDSFNGMLASLVAFKMMPPVDKRSSKAVIRCVIFVLFGSKGGCFALYLFVYKTLQKREKCKNQPVCRVYFGFFGSVFAWNFGQCQCLFDALVRREYAFLIFQ